MQIIYKPRGSGKTTDLIKEAAKTFSYIVCQNYKEADRIRNRARTLGLDISYPITYREFLDGSYNLIGSKSLLIDNVESLLQSISSVPIKAITLTEE